MRHSLQVVAAAAVLALLCGCQSMPTMRPPGQPAPLMASSDLAPAPAAEPADQSVVVNEDSDVAESPGVVHTDSGYVDSYSDGGVGACYGGGEYGYGAYRYQPHCRVGLQARNMHHNFHGPHGPPVAQITYPYYTLRGPRDFLADDPPNLGP